MWRGQVTEGIKGLKAAIDKLDGDVAQTRRQINEIDVRLARQETKMGLIGAICGVAGAGILELVLKATGH